MAAEILLVEDEAAIRTLIRFHLEKAGFAVREAASAAAAQGVLEQALPDLLVVDWMLPGMSGEEWIRRLRSDRRSARLPLILLTARDSEADKEQGLNGGADDYLTKPFSPRELVARINALLRRCAPEKTEEETVCGPLRLNPARHAVCIGGAAVKIGAVEFRLLHFLMTHRDRVYSRSQLLDSVWGDHVFVEERTVDVHIRRLRAALAKGGCDRYIRTVRGSGYCFAEYETE
ncbi:MAG: phosphate regulon transcriptional regulator PhoB [Neisseria sp.]|nr:phosphate regulon transcriptional regulator PhoB [Neisseria sp.]